MSYFPAHETNIVQGTRNQVGPEWRIASTFLEMACDTPERATALADSMLRDPVTRKYFRAGFSVAKV